MFRGLKRGFGDARYNRHTAVHMADECAPRSELILAISGPVRLMTTRYRGRTNAYVHVSNEKRKAFVVDSKFDGAGSTTRARDNGRRYDTTSKAYNLTRRMRCVNKIRSARFSASSFSRRASKRTRNEEKSRTKALIRVWWACRRELKIFEKI